jgi:glucose-6-phosphate 1-dehydrogenase
MKTGESSEFGYQDDNKGSAVMDHNSNRTTPADALVIFGVTGDLAHKKIFPALYAMAKRGVLNVPVVGVAAPKWSQAQLRKQAEDSIKQAGKIDDRSALDHLLSQLQYVGGDYNDPETFKALKQALGDALRTISPSRPRCSR